MKKCLAKSIFQYKVKIPFVCLSIAHLSDIKVNMVPLILVNIFSPGKLQAPDCTCLQDKVSRMRNHKLTVLSRKRRLCHGIHNPQCNRMKFARNLSSLFTLKDHQLSLVTIKARSINDSISGTITLNCIKIAFPLMHPI